MKIQRFNESYYIDDLHDSQLQHSTKLSDETNEFIDDFSASADDGVIGFISTTATSFKIKLTEYKNILDNKNNLIKLAEMKKLKKLQKFSLLEKEINDIENRVEKLIKLRNNLLTESSNELLYKYQEDLLLNDFPSFYNIFIKDSVDYNNEHNEQDNIYGDVHPDILNKFKDLLDENTGYYTSAKKFNI